MSDKLKIGCSLDCEVENGVPVLQTCLIDEGDPNGCYYSEKGKTKADCGFWVDVSLQERNVLYTIKTIKNGKVNYLLEFISHTKEELENLLSKMLGNKLDLHGTLKNMGWEIVELEFFETKKDK